MTAGGSATPNLAVSSVSGILHHLCSTQEDADSRIIHDNDAVFQGFGQIIVNSWDTDILLLLTHHLTADVSMAAGTKQKPNYFPVHQIKSINPQGCQNLLACHAILGCDSPVNSVVMKKK